MTLDQLEAVESIVTRGSFRAAAEHLGRSQPSLSTSIKNLENEFEIQIFDRATYRPRLTEAGSVFVQAARKTLDAARSTSRVATELGMNKAETKLRIAMDPLAPIDAIELIALECARPIVPVVMIMEKTILQGSQSLLREGKVDLALGPVRETNADLEVIEISQTTLVSAVSRKLLQEKREADAEFLKSNAQIFVYDRSVDEPPDELMPNPIYANGGKKIYVPDHLTKLRLISGGLGWGRVSRDEFEAEDELVQIDPKLCEPIELRMCVMRPRNRAIGPIARKIWEIFSQRALGSMSAEDRKIALAHSGFKLP